MSFCSYRTYGTKCSGCKTTIPANEFVMRALGNVYHIQCFVCTMCGHRLEKGQEFALKDNNLYCKEDYGKIPIKGPANSPPHKQQQESELNFDYDVLSVSLLLFFQGLRVTEQFQLTTPENVITYHNALSLSPKILHKHCLQFLLGIKMAPRETENSAYSNFWGDKQRALWYVMLFSGVVNISGDKSPYFPCLM